MASTSALPQPDPFAVPISATPNFKNTQNNPVPDVVKNNSVPIEPSAHSPLPPPQPEPNYYFKRILTKNVKNVKYMSENSRTSFSQKKKPAGTLHNIAAKEKQDAI